MSRKDMNDLIRLAVSQGWRHTRTSKGHHRLIPPPGQKDRNGYPAFPVTLPSTPSDHRSIKNCMAQLRRFGLDDGRGR